jgi:hypothetical protein
VRVQRPLFLVFAVRFRGVVCALVECFELIVAEGRDAEGAALGALEGEESS